MDLQAEIAWQIYWLDGSLVLMRALPLSSFFVYFFFIFFFCCCTEVIEVRRNKQGEERGEQGEEKRGMTT